ncbi:MAG: glucoamylase family protein [Pseudomonadota bacterium]
MKVNSATFGMALDNFSGYFRKKSLAGKHTGEEPPLRSELFSSDQMEQHGTVLANSHELSRKPLYDKLLQRLADNETVLINVYRLFTEAITANLQIAPAGEWLLDNFYLIEEQIRTAKRHLPKGYSLKLPRLLNGPSTGRPRVYDIALETISHGDGQINPESLRSFIAAYQTVFPLDLGELWAIPIMLRLALIENLRRITARIATDRIHYNRADYWADHMAEIARKDPNSMILVVADMARSNPPMVSSFVAELTRRLQGQGVALALPLTWIEQRLAESSLTIEQLVRAETQQQAADQVSVSNSIGSLRFLSAMDWREFVEQLSVVEVILTKDPAEVYAEMDFATRDRYRHVIEKIATASSHSESEVARQAINLADRAAMEKGGDDRSAHVGYYLIAEGLAELQRSAKMRFSAADFLGKVLRRIPFLAYSGTIMLLTATLAVYFAAHAQADGLESWGLGFFLLLLLLCAGQPAIAVVNWLATLLATPRLLPRMDFSKGIPPEMRTLVVIPTMLTSSGNTLELVEALEIRFLANRDSNLHFGLLTDFCDADEEILAEDEPLLRLAEQKISELNEKYPLLEGDTFFLFHRPRLWNPRDRKWMGFERKRGKLADLNGLLRGRGEQQFARVVGNTTLLLSARYVITLDTDTLLARDSAWRFVGTMAHTLNRARYDKDRQRVVAGYGILQPRVAESLSGTPRSRYVGLCGSDPGIDPYTRAVSDVYQDLFGEGSFIGKGIYEVDAFEQALHGRLPDNLILSHDLLEGCYARAGLLSDVQLYEEYPSSYSADVKRRYRWIRGDWQIGCWTLPLVPGSDGKLRRNRLSMLSRWKIFDNLRRSLTAPAFTLLLLLGWTVLASAWFWTLAVIGCILAPSFLSSILGVLQKPSEVTLGQHLQTTIHSSGKFCLQASFTLVCLPYEAFFSLDAMLRTLWRLLVSHRRLLEWSPSGDSQQSDNNGLIASCRALWSGPVFAILVAISLILLQPSVLFVAGPILLLWFASPVITWWVSLPRSIRPDTLTAEQNLFLRRLSRKTWAFFETFLGPDDHWLLPDNFQEHPFGVIAHRTSPTNIGLSLLANLSAYDFGYIPAGILIERTANTLRTMETLERHRGHFYNWYDTQTLLPLLPTYISSVDSGNLGGHLLTLKPGLLGLVDEPIFGRRVFEGLSDTLQILTDLAGDSASVYLAQIKDNIGRALSSPLTTLTAARWCLDQLARPAALVATEIEARHTSSESELRWWALAFARQCREAIDELTLLAPWTEIMSSSAKIGDFAFLDTIPILGHLLEIEARSLPEIDRRISLAISVEEKEWLLELHRLITVSCRQAGIRVALIDHLVRQLEDFAQMDYRFLFDASRRLLAIGYNVGEHRLDSSCYDLLASEARLACFVGIAQGQLPEESWFALGRLLTTTGGEPILLSWSGSMFEYLMPLLVMPSYEKTLLYQTCKAAVTSQIDYGEKRGVPWGISECGYNAIDVHQNYQYRAFGVPGLGLKRGLAEDLVIAPYASVLALMVAPEKACLNLQRLDAEGFAGRYGFYEAIDYTLSRMPPNHTQTVVRSFMAHHQGMSFLALASLLLDRRMQKRFESEPLFQATLLLLQERIPKATAFYIHASELSDSQIIAGTEETPIRVFSSPDTPYPEVQLLSNGRYHVMITASGGGYSRWRDLAITRWKEDSTCDNWGTFCYVRDMTSGKFWSTTYQPVLNLSKNFETVFSEGRAEFRCRFDDLEAYTEVVVSPEDDIELRRITLTNRTRRTRVIEVTSYAEVVLAPPIVDALHPAFSNLFVQTEILPEHRAILCTRRPRSEGEQMPWVMHLMAVHDAQIVDVSYETDRLLFIGRGKSVMHPRAMGDGTDDSGELSGSQGSVLDPIVAIRYRISLLPGESAKINMVTGIGAGRDEALSLAEKYQDRHLADRVFDLAWTHGQVLLRQINATEADAQLYGRLAGAVIYAKKTLRAHQDILKKNRRGQSGLWGYTISGDLPIVLVRIEDIANIDLVRQLVQAHGYWRLKGLAVDLVIWNEDHAGYRQLLHEEITGLIAAGNEGGITDRPGGIFVRHADQIADEDRILFQAVARAILSDVRGTLAEQIGGHVQADIAIPRLIPSRTFRPEPHAVDPLPRHDLLFFNGLGGFTSDGREYVITTAAGRQTPAPWVNVLANPLFGTIVSESGPAFTWSENAHEFRLTPWINDSVSDSSGEAFYIRDEERGHFWSPTPLPCRGLNPYVTRHGFGYSVFEHTERGIHSELWIYVPLDAAIKFSVLKVRNESGRKRKLSATGYVEWVLGDLRTKSAMHVITAIDSKNGALFAHNSYNAEFHSRTGFFDVDDRTHGFTGDRTEFIGRNGTLVAPAAMARVRLSGRVGAGFDPCAALQVNFELAAGQEREIIFKLGVGKDRVDAENLVSRFRGRTAARGALDAVWQHWSHTLGAVNVETPDLALNVLANGWLLYQTLSCRLWARCATYQSGGAFGFRDQLQDVMALIYARPYLVREHLLFAASRQFEEGDAQHWWHPPQGRGVRTHCSDDYLWLPLATYRYVTTTGDSGILDESVRFLQGRPVNADEDSYYDLPIISEEATSLYDHCVRAIERGLIFGEHGLPLIGSCDWNDGMNLVGEHGKGESVWLGFFLYEVLMRFAEVAGMRGDISFVERCHLEAAELRRNIEEHGWDGEWYRRAYFDNGTPLGSSVNSECRIDSIAQSWSVLSGAGGKDRSHLAMESVDKHLVRREHRLIQLLDPPFDKSALNPGYIKGYVPGVRENGGQYTHAAIWAAMAFAQLGDKKRAWELFTMINPVNHGRSADETAVYKVEPYVVAADVYALAPHTGRGGWTWYTGSAAWMYRLIIESLLGLRLDIDKLHFTPCLPPEWDGFKLHYRYRETVYHISVRQLSTDAGVVHVWVDGREQLDLSIPLVDDHKEHMVEVRIGAETKEVN